MLDKQHRLKSNKPGTVAFDPLNPNPDDDTVPHKRRGVGAGPHLLVQFARLPLSFPFGYSCINIPVSTSNCAMKYDSPACMIAMLCCSLTMKTPSLERMTAICGVCVCACCLPL